MGPPAAISPMTGSDWLSLSGRRLSTSLPTSFESVRTSARSESLRVVRDRSSASRPAARSTWEVSSPRRATDAHKWLNVPYDSGIVFVRGQEHLNAAMAASAAYLKVGESRKLFDGTEGLGWPQRDPTTGGFYAMESIPGAGASPKTLSTASDALGKGS